MMILELVSVYIYRSPLDILLDWSIYSVYIWMFDDPEADVVVIYSPAC